MIVWRNRGGRLRMRFASIRFERIGISWITSSLRTRILIFRSRCFNLSRVRWSSRVGNWF